MPVHRCSFDALEERVDEIEKSERIVAVVPHGDAVCIVTEPSRRSAPKGVERR